MVLMPPTRCGWKKVIGAWGSDLTTERTPHESGLGFLLKPEAREFTGRKALLQRMETDDRWEMVLLEIRTDNVDPFYSHSIFHDGKPVGIITSAGYGHRTNKALGLGYLRTRDLRNGLSVKVLGKSCEAIVLNQPPFDPDNLRMKG